MDIEKIACNFHHCAHGMAPAGSGGCYAGDPTDEHCKGFITDEEFEKNMIVKVV